MSNFSEIQWLYGIDGCRGGWVIAKATSHFEQLTIEVTRDLAPIFAKAGVDAIVAIDIPIGIPEHEPRACDSAARQLLRWPRSSSVFSPPVRRALHAATFQEALRINREAAGVGISKQAFHIMRKILEVDRLIRPEKQSHIYEVHPEVTFVQLNGRSLLHSKKEARGRLDRIRLLRHAGLRVSGSWIIRQRARLGTSSVFPDDLIDAMACLVTAFHIREGRSRCLGRTGQRDANNLAMEIYCSGGL